MSDRSITFIDIEFEDVLRPVLGEPCWQAQKGYGSFLTCEFGMPQLRIGHRIDRFRNNDRRRSIRVAGSHHLWIEQCDWWIYENADLLACSESGDDHIAHAVDRIDSQIFDTAEASGGAGNCNFRFEGGLEIRMTPYKDEFFDPDDPVWHLYGPEMIYSFHASGKFSVEPQ